MLIYIDAKTGTWGEVKEIRAVNLAEDEVHWFLEEVADSDRALIELAEKRGSPWIQTKNV